MGRVSFEKIPWKRVQTGVDVEDTFQMRGRGGRLKESFVSILNQIKTK